MLHRRFKNFAIAAQRVIILEAILLNVDDSQRPVIPVTVDRDKDVFVVIDIFQLCLCLYSCQAPRLLSHSLSLSEAEMCKC